MTIQKFKKMESLLNQEQQKVVDLALAGENLCVLGAGGTGKTFLLNVLVEKLRRRGKNVLVCAYTGVAADLASGITVHKAFGFDAGPAFRKNGEFIEHAPKSIRMTDVVIVDEISMLRMDYFDSLTASIRKANADRRIMGLTDIQLIVMGDFYQLPPVLTREDRPILEKNYNREVGEGFSFMARFWDDWEFDTVQLTEIVRQGDPEFIKHLNELRVGDPSCLSYFNNRVGPAQKDAVSLYPYRNERDKENARRLNEETEFDTKDIIFDAAYIGDVFESDFPTVESSLHLRTGAPVMLLSNYNPKSDECENLSRLSGWEKKDFLRKGDGPEDLYHNGDIGRVVSIQHGKTLDEDAVIIDINGHDLQFTRHEFPCYEYVFNKKNQKTRLKKTGAALQFNFILAYGLTIHKAQGKTINKVNITTGCFCPGQIYVALSRCRGIDGITLLSYMTDRDLMVSDAVTKFYASII